MTYKRPFWGLLLGLVLALGQPGGAARADVEGLNVVAPEERFPRVGRTYPTMDARYARTATNRSVAQVRQVAIGSTKDALRAALGDPVSRSGSRSWYFSIGLPLARTHRLVCQYRVFFDSDNRVSGTAWRRPQCADIVTR